MFDSHFSSLYTPFLCHVLWRRLVLTWHPPMTAEAVLTDCHRRSRSWPEDRRCAAAREARAVRFGPSQSQSLPQTISTRVQSSSSSSVATNLQAWPCTVQVEREDKILSERTGSHACEFTEQAVLGREFLSALTLPPAFSRKHIPLACVIFWILGTDRHSHSIAGGSD